MQSLYQLVMRFARLFVWWTIIQPWERGLRVRRGRFVTVLQPGVHLRLPILDAIYSQSIRLRYSNLPLQTLVTRDSLHLVVGGTLGYAIADIHRLYDTLHHAEDTVRSLVCAAIADVVSRSDVAAISRETLSQSVIAAVPWADYGLGDPELRVTDLTDVRAVYRVIKDDRWGSHGGGLNTIIADPAIAMDA